ncbi:MAG: ExeA family protein [Methanosarcinaceae archaeon]
MYNHFFGFKEKPFKLVPNPDYLFLSKSHEEALAHLKYTAVDGEGFVEILGEVGSGKTMLCRAFLENLDANTESAYIFNPKMDAIDLLKSINDEFDILSDQDSIKALIDTLNAFLMGKRAEGKKVILLIDEAQNLNKEVLEQIRLLSNLETTKDKLLQIILVGQPELGEMLRSYDLRQIGQRISLRCRLLPLSYQETNAYIQHRIHLASQKQVAIFSRNAIRKIYKYSSGNPRLINITCDRALLTAYGFNCHKISSRIAKAAIIELSNHGEIKRYVVQAGQKRLILLFVLCVALGGTFFYQTANPLPKAVLPVPTPTAQIEARQKEIIEPVSIESAKTKMPAMATGIFEPEKGNAMPDFKQMLVTLPAKTTRAMSVKTVSNKWGINARMSPDLNGFEDDEAFFSLAALQNGLILQLIDDNLNLILNLNLCAILKFELPENHYPIYLTVIKAKNHALTLSDGKTGRKINVLYDDIVKYWTGTGFVFWKNFYNYQRIIPRNSPKESIIALKMHLRDIGFKNIEINTNYDSFTQLAIKAIQAKHGIPVDGIVGPLTKIVLYNEKKLFAIPHLWQTMKERTKR